MVQNDLAASTYMYIKSSNYNWTVLQILLELSND